MRLAPVFFKSSRIFSDSCFFVSKSPLSAETLRAYFASSVETSLMSCALHPLSLVRVRLQVPDDGLGTTNVYLPVFRVLYMLVGRLGTICDGSSERSIGESEPWVISTSTFSA